MVKKIAGILLLALAAVVAVPANATIVVLDFEDLSGTGPMPDPYAGIVNWEDGVWNHYDWSQPPYNPSSGVQRTYQSSDLTPGWTFLAPVVFLGASWSGQSYASITWYLYDASDVLVHTSATMFGSSTSTFLATGYSGLVTRVEAYTPSADQIVMDDLTYDDDIAVPEPVSLLLLAMGLMGLGVARRRHY